MRHQSTNYPNHQASPRRRPRFTRFTRLSWLVVLVVLSLISSVTLVAASTPGSLDTLRTRPSDHYTPDEAYDHALALLRSVTLADDERLSRATTPPSSKPGTPTPSSSESGAVSKWTRSWVDAALYDTGPLGRLATIGRRWWRPQKGRSKRRTELDLADLPGKEWVGAQPRQVWPAWELHPDTAILGPFLGDDTDDVQSYTDRTLAYLVSSVVQLASKARTKQERKPTSRWTPQERRNQRVSYAEQLLLWVAGNPLEGPELSASALVDDVLSRHPASSNDTLSDPSLALPHHSEQHNPRQADALWVLGEHFLWGTHGVRSNASAATHCFARLADLTGNSTAHARLGFLHASRWTASTAELVTRDGLFVPPYQRKDVSEETPHAQALANLHYATAARQGDSEGQIALAYRHWVGIGTSPSCNLAMQWYEAAADQAYARFISGPPGGLTLPGQKVRLSDFVGGVYGPGASVASTGRAAREPLMRAILEEHPGLASSEGHTRGVGDLLEFYEYHANHGEVSFIQLLAQVYYHGSLLGPGEQAGMIPRDYKRALQYFLRITSQVWIRDSGSVARTIRPGQPIDLKVASTIDPRTPGTSLELGTQASLAASRIGSMYLRGEGVPQDFNRAWVWFRRGMEFGDTSALVYMGMMYRDGLGMEMRNVTQAARLFTKATTQSLNPEAPAQLGKILFDMGEFAEARDRFRVAVQRGNNFEARYFLAKLDAAASRASSTSSTSGTSESSTGGTGGGSSNGAGAGQALCRSAVTDFKTIVERADWDSPVYNFAERAWRHGDRSAALTGWMIAGEKGYEAAQNNLAWILDRDTSLLHRWWTRGLGANEHEAATDRLALLQWSRSAAQGNIDSLVKMGDYYFHGLGTSSISASSASTAQTSASSSSNNHATPSPRPGADLVPKYNKAAACYQSALDQTSSLAYWNMAWMYEMGLGVPRQNFYLAKRYYDMAWDINQAEPYLPILLSLIRLHWRALGAALRGDKSALHLWSQYTLGGNNAQYAYTEQEEPAVEQQHSSAPSPDQPSPADAAQGSGHQPHPPIDPQDQQEGTWDDEWEYEDLGEFSLEGLVIVLLLGALAYLYLARRQVQQQLDQLDANPNLNPTAQAQAQENGTEPDPAQAEAAEAQWQDQDDARVARFFADAAMGL